MSDKYTKGARCYHVIPEGDTLTRCGWDFASVQSVVETVKDTPSLPTCAGCAAVPDGLPNEVRDKKHQK
jgi:hypothetical protein